ncbi:MULTISPECIES: effector-associated domain EAD1-containing protein [Nostocales]|uniref:Effector-associated domain-containing protein n=4 Tax=Nostocales TaxID=1161 RepID=A0A0C1NE46_9CYAN|nr:effector-associated domain EAD1-containing protein [Tolypothrix bouteillei]
MLEKLEGKQRKRLQEALMSAFPSFTKLEQMVSFGFNENLDNLAGGYNSDLGYVIFKLIEWSEAKGKLQQLLIVVRSEEDGGNSSNTKLKEICEELQQGQTVRGQSYELMNRSQFDLTEIIAECCSNLLGKNGLVGFALPCDHYTCLESFCRRLQNEFNGRNIQCQDSLSLNPKHSSVELAIKRIQSAASVPYCFTSCLKS